MVFEKKNTICETNKGMVILCSLIFVQKSEQNPVICNLIIINIAKSNIKNTVGVENITVYLISLCSRLDYFP